MFVSPGDDLAYMTKTGRDLGCVRAHRSIMIAANQRMAFPGPAMTLAAVDRPVYHPTIFAIKVDSDRPR